MMMILMFFLSKHYQIFYAIICSYSVFMMHVLILRKFSSKMLLNQESMLHNISSFFRRIFIFLKPNHDISRSMDTFSSTPTWMFFWGSIFHLERMGAIFRTMFSQDHERRPSDFKEFITIRTFFNQARHESYYS